MALAVTVNRLEQRPGGETAAHAGFEDALGPEVSSQAPGQSDEARVTVVPSPEGRPSNPEVPRVEVRDRAPPYLAEAVGLRTRPERPEKPVHLPLGIRAHRVVDASGSIVAPFADLVEGSLKGLARVTGEHPAGTDGVSEAGERTSCRAFDARLIHISSYREAAYR